jgi:hypothetical protein
MRPCIIGVFVVSPKELRFRIAGVGQSGLSR